MKLVIASLLMLVPLAAHGQLFKCVGQDGSVEYAAQCPPGTKELQTGIKSSREGPSSSPSSPQQKSLAERDADFKKRMLESEAARQKQDKATAEAADKRQNCDSAQTYLKGLQGGQRYARVDPKTGERIFLEDADRSSEIAKAQRAVDQNCT